jgi:hypothetical protein
VLRLACVAAREAKDSFHLAVPCLFEASRVVTRQSRRRTAIRAATAQVNVRDRLEAFPRCRLEADQVGALRPWELAEDGVPRGFLQPRLHSPRLKRREPLGELRLDAKDQAREMPFRRVERILPEEVGDPRSVLARLEEACPKGLDTTSRVVSIRLRARSLSPRSARSWARKLRTETRST